MSSENLTLYPRFTKLILLLLTCVVFATLGVWMINDNDLRGWLVVGFFGPCSLIVLCQFIPGANYLRLTRDGISYSTFFRKRSHKWDEIFEFGAYEPSSTGSKYVGFNFKQRSKSGENLNSFSKTLSGWESGIPDTYGMSAEELVEILESWRKKYS